MENYNEKDIEKKLNRPVGYNVFTISSTNGYKKVAIKKNIFNKKFKIIYFNEDIDSIEEKIINSIKIYDNIIELNPYGPFVIRDLYYSLFNPKKRITKDNEIYRNIDRVARDEEITKSNRKQAEIISAKDKQINEIKEESKRLEEHYTINKSKRLRKITEDLFTTTIKHSSYDYEMVNKGKYNGGYQMESKSTSYEITKKRGIEFLVQKLEEISNTIGSDAFTNNRLLELANRCDILFKNYDNGYDEKTTDHIQAIYGLMAEELTARLISLCNYINKSNINTTELKYNKLIYTNNSNYYEEEHSYTEYEVIDNYFESVVEASCVFIERVTGQDIRSNITNKDNQETTLVYKNKKGILN